MSLRKSADLPEGLQHLTHDAIERMHLTPVGRIRLIRTAPRCDDVAVASTEATIANTRRLSSKMNRRTDWAITFHNDWKKWMNLTNVFSVSDTFFRYCSLDFYPKLKEALVTFASQPHQSRAGYKQGAGNGFRCRYLRVIPFDGFGVIKKYLITSTFFLGEV